jgi:hypothetical protein
MIGTNRVVLNAASVSEALTDYLNKHSLTTYYVKVTQWGIDDSELIATFVSAKCEVAANE